MFELWDVFFGIRNLVLMYSNLLINRTNALFDLRVTPAGLVPIEAWMFATIFHLANVGGSRLRLSAGLLAADWGFACI